MSREFVLQPRGPFSFAAARGMLAEWAPVRRFSRGDGDVLRITFLLDGDFTPTAVALRESHGALVGEVVGTDRVDAVAAQVARMFSLDVDARDYPAVGARDARVGALMRALPGLRPVLFSSPYEAAAWAVVSQRISMHQAAMIEERFVNDAGVKLRIAGADVRVFPPPDRLRRVREIASLPSEKVARLHAVAAAAEGGLLDAARLRALGDDGAPRALRAIRGIGAFWSQGIYLRACGVRDVFPDEPRAIAALGRLHGLGDAPSASAVAQLTERFRPYRMWICFLLRVASGRDLIQSRLHC
jgi:DNA-3-methyladenine glycosylase II